VAEPGILGYREGKRLRALVQKIIDEADKTGI
jgi:hypothetical protein